MADDNVIIEGNVKYREGKKWKSRWCVMRKLSPVADCVQLQIWRDGRARCGGGGGGCKAAFSLQQYVGYEAGFTLDKHSNTLALLCHDLIAILAFDTRERLMQWQVKVDLQVGPSREYLVQVAARAGRARPGPARLHVAPRRAALAAGLPPRLVAIWELQHLRRYGVVEGRFCLEGGSKCTRGAGLYVLVSDRAAEITRAFDHAAAGTLRDSRADIRGKCESRQSQQSFRPDTRLSELQQAATPGDGEEREPWPSAEGLGSDSVSACGAPPAESGGVALARCRSCMSKIGAMSRSSTAALTPGAKHFSPNWIMDEPASLPRSVSGECRCLPPAPAPPPRPPRKPLPGHACRTRDDIRVGPYENYDVPKLPSAEVDGEYYDTPKRLKECLNDDLFKLTKSSTPNTLILKKPCGCLLKVGRRKREPNVVEEDEGVGTGAGAGAACACRRVTAWAHGWITRRAPSHPATPLAAAPPVLPAGKENLRPSVSEHSALYAMVDVSRKTRRRALPTSEYSEPEPCLDSRNIEIDDGPLANYENLNFALSLEHYENAKDVLKSAGLTPRELSALSLSLHADAAGAGRLRASVAGAGCERCGRAPGDEYLVMTPTSRAPPVAGYTPMSPLGLAARSLARPPRPRPSSLLEEKSASNPALFAAEVVEVEVCEREGARERDRRCDARKRSSSADSSRFLDDVVETGGSNTSIDTLLPAGDERDDLQEVELQSRRAAAAAGVRRAASVPAACRDSSSSNDSGVSVCSNAPLAATAAAAAAPPPRPRRTRSTDPLQERTAVTVPAKSSSAEAEVPVHMGKPLRSAVHSRSTSSVSELSDYLETMSLCSSHSSSDAPLTMRVVRQTTSTLRPRSGKEYLPVSGGACRPPPPSSHARALSALPP